MFKENFIRLCNERGESPSSVCKKVNITPATFSGWDSNSVPRQATLLRIADYFGVPVESLTADTTKTKALVFNESFTESEKELVVAYRKHPEMHEAIKTILGIRKEETVMRGIFEISFEKGFTTCCEEKNTTKEEVCSAINVPLDIVETIFKNENTEQYPILNKIAKHLKVAPDSLLDIHLGEELETDFYNARERLSKPDTPCSDKRVLEAFANYQNFKSGLDGSSRFWVGNISGLAYIANCSINELVGRPRPLDSEGVYNVRAVAEGQRRINTDDDDGSETTSTQKH